MQNFADKNKKIYPLYDCVEFSWLSNGGTLLFIRFEICEKMDFEVKICKIKKYFLTVMSVRAGIHLDVALSTIFFKDSRCQLFAKCLNSEKMLMCLSLRSQMVNLIYKVRSNKK